MSIENLAQYVSTIEDPRCSGKVEHRLMDICGEPQSSASRIAIIGGLCPRSLQRA